MPIPFDLGELLPPLSSIFGQPAQLHPVRFDLSPAYSPQRDQYNSTQILLQLREQLGPGVDRLIGVVDVDLFVPVLTYVFGEAQLSGQLAVASTFRLREPWLQHGAPAGVFRSRLLKTLLHELGHTVGLRHCADYSCIMTSASSLEMLDEKSETFCLKCRASIAKARRKSP